MRGLFQAGRDAPHIESMFLAIGSNVPYSKQPWVCYVIFCLNLAMYIISSSVGIDAMSPLYFRPFDNNILTTISSAFLHADFIHFTTNMLMFYIVAFNVESRMGHGRFAAFYLLACITSALTHGTLDQLHLYLGASGAIFALIGAYLILYCHARLRLIIWPIHLIFMLVVFFKPEIYFTTESLWLSLLLLFGLLLFIRIHLKASIVFALFMIWQLRMGLASMDHFKGQISFWGHIGGFAFGVLFTSLFYGTGGLFRKVDGSVMDNLPKFVQRFETKRLQREIAHGIFEGDGEGGVTYQEEIEPEKLAAIARLQQLVHKRSIIAAVETYEGAIQNYDDLVLSPGPHLLLGGMLLEGGRPDLCIHALENLLKKHPEFPDAIEAKIKLARAYSKDKAHYHIGFIFIQELKNECKLRKDLLELEKIEAKIQDRIAEEAPADEAVNESDIFAAALPEQDEVALGYADFDFALEKMKEEDAPNVPTRSLDEANGENPSPDETAVPSPAMPPPLPKSVDEQRVMAGVQEQTASSAAPQPAHETAEQTEPPEDEAGFRFAVPWNNRQAAMVLLRPDRSIEIDAMIEAQMEFFELKKSAAERQFRSGKGVLLANADYAQAEEYCEFLAAKGIEALVLPVMPEFDFGEAVNAVAFDWNAEEALIHTYAEGLTFEWKQVFMLSGGRMDMPGAAADETRRVLDFFLIEPRHHVRIWEDMFSPRRSKIDDVPLPNAQVGPLYHQVVQRASQAVRSRSLEKALQSPSRQPHEFFSLEEYDNYNTWMLYTRCADWRSH
ncbi:rhomboid family intramembrane serine protease [Candidatus Sumerlaeota bacterium]|nr:rhomboid family intramembrane serine protease [Candidatus Sumerlaeota bacterium]